MLGLSKILKRRTQQNVFLQSSRKPWMQVYQRTVRWIKLTQDPFAVMTKSINILAVVVGLNFNPTNHNKTEPEEAGGEPA
jgi:hypothetical protein